MTRTLDGKIVLITGAATGIGKAVALASAQQGAKLIVADTQEEPGRTTVELITKQGGEAIFVSTDVTDAASVQAMVAKAVAHYGRLDGALNNAGISGVGIGGSQRPVTADYPDERWDRVLAVNLTGVFLCMKAEIRQMLQQGGGSIVNMASVVGLVAVVNNAAYVASKHGVVGLTRTAALEYAKQNIRINCACPGYVETPMTAAGLQDPTRKAMMMASQPQGRLGTAEEVAQAVVWLLSDSASFVLGSALTIDGGYSAQ